VDQRLETLALPPALLAWPRREDVDVVGMIEDVDKENDGLGEGAHEREDGVRVAGPCLADERLLRSPSTRVIADCQNIVASVIGMPLATGIRSAATLR